MKINPTNLPGSAPPSHGAPARVPKHELDKNDFLKLLLAQMKKQNPMKPIDNSEMMQQMAQMASLTATEELTSSVKMLNTNLGNSQVLSATQLIGKRIAVESSKAELVADKVGGEDRLSLDGAIGVPLNGTTSDIDIEIRDNNNNVVSTIKLPPSKGGIVDYHWDGKNAAGEKMAPGFYSISAKTMIGGKSESLPTAGFFKVASVTLDKAHSSTIINLDGIGGITMDKILKILG